MSDDPILECIEFAHSEGRPYAAEAAEEYRSLLSRKSLDFPVEIEGRLYRCAGVERIGKFVHGHGMYARAVPVILVKKAS